MKILMGDLCTIVLIFAKLLYPRVDLVLYLDLNRKIERNDCAAAIEMSPKFHALLCLELGVDFTTLTSYEGLPIVFIPSGEVAVINGEQYKLREKYNEILRIYKGKYGEYKNFINNKYKFVNMAFMSDMLISELSRLSGRLINIEMQINKLGKV